MYEFPPRKVQTRRRIISLIFSFILVVAGATFLTAITSGYVIDNKNNSLTRNGILQINSRPSGAEVYVDDKRFPTNTKAKLVISPRDYDIRIQKTGYKSWNKVVPVQPDNITWLEYPRLFPEKISTEEKLVFEDGLSQFISSYDSQFFAALVDTHKPKIKIVNIQDKNNLKTKEIDLSPDLVKMSPDETKNVFEIEKWSNSDKYILLKYTNLDQPNMAPEHILVNVSKPAESVNLVHKFAFNVDQIEFINEDEFYALIDGSVRNLNLASSTISAPLAQNVEEFSLFNDYVLFVSKPSEQNLVQVGYTKKDFKKPVVISSVDQVNQTKVFLNIGRYYDKNYILIANGQKGHLYQTGDLGDSDGPILSIKEIATLETTSPIIAANISSNGQLATIQSKDELVNYNLEINQKKIAKLMPTSLPNSPLKMGYLDTYLMFREANGFLRVYEFDGENQHDLFKYNPEFDISFDRSGDYIYYITINKAGKLALDRAKIKL